MNSKKSIFLIITLYLLLIVFLIITYIVIHYNFSILITATISIHAVMITVYFSYQQDRIEKIKLFKTLFTEFNARYEKINNELLKLADLNKDEQKAILDEYFNLCAEEYLFYREKLIIEHVWSSWIKGMRNNLENEIIKEYWDEAKKDDSFYDLNLD